MEIEGRRGERRSAPASPDEDSAGSGSGNGRSSPRELAGRTPTPRAATRGKRKRGTQFGQRLLGWPTDQQELRCKVKRPVSDEIAGTGACRKRSDAAVVQQPRRRGSQAVEPAIRSNRNVEGREASQPLPELKVMGEEIRDAAVFLVVTS